MELSYIGTSFKGWQSQPNGLAVQDFIERALQTILRHPVRVIGSSRTDTGVHAEHQVATFRTPLAIELPRLHKSLNAVLPESIGVMSLSLAEPNFHPIFSTKGKVYRYRIWRGQGIPAYFKPFVWQLPPNLQWDLFRKHAQDFIGQHDFTSFCATDSSAKTKVRQIFEIICEERGPLLDIWISGEGFLKQMIRSIIGTLVEFAREKRPGQTIPQLIAAQDRTIAGQTAPAMGLSLVRIFYDEILPLPRFIAEANRGFCYPIIG